MLLTESKLSVLSINLLFTVICFKLLSLLLTGGLCVLFGTHMRMAGYVRQLVVHVDVAYLLLKTCSHGPIARITRSMLRRLIILTREQVSSKPSEGKGDMNVRKAKVCRPHHGRTWVLE